MDFEIFFFTHFSGFSVQQSWMATASFQLTNQRKDTTRGCKAKSKACHRCHNGGEGSPRLEPVRKNVFQILCSTMQNIFAVEKSNKLTQQEMAKPNSRSVVTAAMEVRTLDMT